MSHEDATSDVIGIRTWFWIAGLVTLLMGMAGFFIPEVMNVESNRAGELPQSAPPVSA